MLVALVTGGCVSQIEEPVVRGPLIEQRGVYPAGTPTPAGYAPGLVMVRDYNRTITPRPGQIGSNAEFYWDDVQPNLAVTPNWRAAKTRVAYIASQGMGAWLSLQTFENDWGARPDIVYAPVGVPIVTYSAGPCGTEYTPNYGSTTFRNAYATAVASFLNTFGDDPNVAGFAINLGASAETVNAYSQTVGGVACNNQQYLETTVSCTAFTDWVKMALVSWREGTNKPLTLATNLSACSTKSGYSSAQMFMEYANPPTPTGTVTPGAVATPLYIGYRAAGLNADSWRSWMYGTPAPWGWFQPGSRYSDLGGAYYEPGSPYGYPAYAPTAEAEGYAQRMLWIAAADNAGNADNIFLQKEWWDYIDADVLDVITQTLGMDANTSNVAWVVFQQREFPFGGNMNRGYSGTNGPLTFLADVDTASTAASTSFCIPSVRATAVSAAATYGAESTATPGACQSALVSPIAPESRNTIFYPSSARILIDIADAWQHAGAEGEYRVTARYLGGPATLSYKTASGIVTRTLSRSAGAWKSDVLTSMMLLDNGTSSGADFEILAGANGIYLNRLVVEWMSGPTPTPTGSVTPSRTLTPMATDTPTPTLTSDADRFGYALAHADADGDRHSDSDPDADADRFGHALAHADADGDRHSDAHPDADADRFGHALAHADADSDRHSDAHPDADADRFSHALAHADADGDRHSDAHPDADADRFGHALAHADADRHSDAHRVKDAFAHADGNADPVTCGVGDVFADART